MTPVSKSVVYTHMHVRIIIECLVVKIECLVVKIECLVVKIECLVVKIECLVVKIECLVVKIVPGSKDRVPSRGTGDDIPRNWSANTFYHSKGTHSILVPEHILS